MKKYDVTDFMQTDEHIKKHYPTMQKKERMDLAIKIDGIDAQYELVDAIGLAFGSNSDGKTFLEFIGMQLRDLQNGISIRVSMDE